MILATTPRTSFQLIDYSRIPALQLPEGIHNLEGHKHDRADTGRPRTTD